VPVLKILIIKLRAVGDVVLSTIVTKNLRLAYPGAEIHYLTEPASAEVLLHNRYVDRTLVYRKRTMSGWALIRMVRRERYDVVIDLFGNPRTALVTRLSGARIRAGFRFRGRAYAYTVVAEPRGDRVHNTQFNLDALIALGIEIQDRNIYFGYGPEDVSFINSFLTDSTRPLVCINQGGGWYTKRWGREKFAALADRVAEEFGARIILAWGPGEQKEVEELRGLMKQEAIIPPPTNLPQLGAMLARCALMITNDSGPMHIGAAVGVPVLGIYGPTNPALQGPYGDRHAVVRNESLDCLGCNYTQCPIGHPCMLELDVEDVMLALRQTVRANNLFA
jgi:ADP-heptose:LPS heptosyltransferase